MGQPDPNTPLSDDYLRSHANDPDVAPFFTSAERRRLSGLTPVDASNDERGMLSKAADAVVDTGIGAAKGLGNTVYGLGKMVHDYTPIGRISDAIQPGAFTDANKPPELTPHGTAQTIGHGAEQIAEFFLPTGEAGMLAKVPGLAKAGIRAGVQAAGLTKAQGGSNLASGVSGAITAAIPGGGAAKKAAGMLEEGANKTMAQALGATKEWAKDEAAGLAPEMLKRGVRGSREAMLDQATKATEDVGAKIGQAYTAAGAAGETVPAAAVRGQLEKAAEKIGVTDASGAGVAIEGTQRVAKKLAKLDQFVAGLGDDIPVDKAAKIKQTWDHIVSQAGLYGQKAGASATDSADAWAIREGAGAFRELLNANPTIQTLNKEFAFWKGLQDVLTATKLRTQAQGGGLISAGMGGVGAVAGALSGDTASDRAQNAVIGGLAGRQLIKVIQSPAWRTTVTGPMKQKLAEALASGNAERISSAVGRIVAAAPSAMQAATAQ